MPFSFLFLLPLGIASCGVVAARQARQSSTQNYTFDVPTGSCNQAILFDLNFDRSTLLADVGIDRKNLCLAEGHFDVSVVVNSISAAAGSDCGGGPHGSVAMSTVNISYQGGDGVPDTTFTCPSRSLLNFSSADAATIEQTINNCLGLIAADTANVRAAFNKKVTTMRIYATGSCSDLCTAMNLDMTVALPYARLSIGEECK